MNDTAPLAYVQWQWMKANKGVFELVAKRQKLKKVTADYVRKVFWGNRRSIPVYRALKRRGAPLKSMRRGRPKANV